LHVYAIYVVLIHFVYKSFYYNTIVSFHSCSCIFLVIVVNPTIGIVCEEREEESQDRSLNIWSPSLILRSFMPRITSDYGGSKWKLSWYIKNLLMR